MALSDAERSRQAANAASIRIAEQEQVRKKREQEEKQKAWDAALEAAHTKAEALYMSEWKPMIEDQVARRGQTKVAIELARRLTGYEARLKQDEHALLIAAEKIFKKHGYTVASKVHEDSGCNHEGGMGSVSAYLNVSW